MSGRKIDTMKSTFLKNESK